MDRTLIKSETVCVFKLVRGLIEHVQSEGVDIQHVFEQILENLYRCLQIQRAAQGRGDLIKAIYLEDFVGNILPDFRDALIDVIQFA